MNFNERSRPGGAAPVDETAIRSDSDSTNVHRKSWSRALIDKATRPIEAYGSPEWCALPLDHPNRVAAVVLAAEAWAWDWEHLEENLRREVESLRAGFKKAEDEEYARNAAEHRRQNERRFGRVVSSFEERRAAQLEAAKPRVGDFPGLNGGGIA
jgi:hypothetical protein